VTGLPISSSSMLLRGSPPSSAPPSNDNGELAGRVYGLIARPCGRELARVWLQTREMRLTRGLASLVVALCICSSSVTAVESGYVSLSPAHPAASGTPHDRRTRSSRSRDDCLCKSDGEHAQPPCGPTRSSHDQSTPSTCP
jgi:hypothetical protein